MQWRIWRFVVIACFLIGLTPALAVAARQPATPPPASGAIPDCVAGSAMMVGASPRPVPDRLHPLFTCYTSDPATGIYNINATWEMDSGPGNIEIDSPTTGTTENIPHSGTTLIHLLSGLLTVNVVSMCTQVPCADGAAQGHAQVGTTDANGVLTWTGITDQSGPQTLQPGSYLWLENVTVTYAVASSDDVYFSSLATYKIGSGGGCGFACWQP